MKKNYTMSLGRWGEDVAVQYLKERNFDIIARRWQRREGEIDIIAYDRHERCLALIEVKTRTSKAYGRPEEAINKQKLNKLENMVYRYILESGFKGDYRLDAIFVKKKKAKIKVEYLKNIHLS